MPDPLPYATPATAESPRRARPLLAGVVLGVIALGLTAAGCVLLREASPIVVVPPLPAYSPFAPLSEREAVFQAHALAAAWTPAKTVHVAALYTAAAACFTAAALVLRVACRTLTSASRPPH